VNRLRLIAILLGSKVWEGKLQKRAQSFLLRIKPIPCSLVQLHNCHKIRFARNEKELGSKICHCILETGVCRSPAKGLLKIASMLPPK